jgi:hypothetical protein
MRDVITLSTDGGYDACQSQTSDLVSSLQSPGDQRRDENAWLRETALPHDQLWQIIAMPELVPTSRLQPGDAPGTQSGVIALIPQVGVTQVLLLALP